MNFVNNESISKNVKFVQHEKVDATPNFDNTKKIMALIVEDDATTHKIHDLLLRKASVKPSVAKNREDAVNYFVSGALFDLVLMDTNMPIMNGSMVFSYIFNNLQFLYVIFHTLFIYLCVY